MAATAAVALMFAATPFLIPTVAERIEGHFINTGPWRASLAARIRTAVGRTPARLTSRMRTLDVAAAFEQAMEAYDQLEYAAALRAVGLTSSTLSREAVATRSA